MKYFPAHDPVVESQYFISDYLIIFMPFTRNKNNIGGTGKGNCCMDCRPAIGDDAISLLPGNDPVI
jgi:hypothetical protein